MNKIAAFLSLIIIIISFNSCGQIAKAKAKKHFTETRGAIPSTFGASENEVLLIVLRNRSSYDRYLKSASKRYLGKVKFIRSADVMQDQYKDKTVYRYLFDYVEGSTSIVQYSNGMQNSVTFKQFYINDRLTGKNYMSGYETAYFGKALKAYMENLELKRISLH